MRALDSIEFKKLYKILIKIVQKDHLVQEKLL